MLNYNDVLMAQERQADMRRAAAEENRKRALLGDANNNIAQRVAAMVVAIQQRLMRPGAKVKSVGKVMPGEAA
ncbi:MAG TPA: hypothetical protein DCL15_23140 [Chloroflexi bacterium]|nr:hypothetical protein [Chloroflexota bacterium]HHW86975.1 DUF1003 domain-containing protein [Chloroflexota bacterium]